MNRSKTAVAAMNSVIALTKMTCAASREEVVVADLSAMNEPGETASREVESPTFDLCEGDYIANIKHL